MAQDNVENAKRWFADNYIELCAKYIPNNNIFTLDFCDLFSDPGFDKCNALRKNMFCRIIIQQKWTGVLSFIREMIDNEYYIILWSDFYYIPLSNKYLKEHSIQQILIYGYNDNLGLLFAAAFFDYNYRFEKIPYNSLVKAFSEVESNEFQPQNISWVCKCSPTIREVTTQKVILLIEQHLKGQIIQDRKFYYGLKCYDFIADKAKSGEFKIEYAHAMWNHKKAMRLRFEYLEEMHIYLIDNNNMLALKQIEKMAEHAYKILLKNNIKEGKTIKENIVESYLEIKETEIKVLNSIMQNMKKSSI